MKGALLDSLQGFLAGLLDGWTRPLIALLALPLGLGVTAWPVWSDGMEVMLMLLSAFLGYPIGLGVWTDALGILGLIIGALLALTIAVSFICFWAEHGSNKKSWFILWAASCVYYAIFTIKELSWSDGVLSAAIFTGFTFLYWWGPLLLVRLLERGTPDEPEEAEAKEPEGEQIG